MDLAEIHAIKKSASAPLAKAPAKNNRRALPTYKQAIREVILMREENEEEHQQRLARMVMTRWRLPVDRRLFEEQLILSLQVRRRVPRTGTTFTYELRRPLASVRRCAPTSTKTRFYAALSTFVTSTTSVVHVRARRLKRPT